MADEVRKLAEQSAEATKNISDMIIELVNDTNESIETFVQLSEINAHQNTMVIDTKTAFSDINDNILQVKESIFSVSSKINEILAENDIIIKSIYEVSTVSENTMANTEETDTLMLDFIEKNEMANKIVIELKKASEAMKKYTH